MFLKNRNIISKIKRSKVTDYAALRVFKDSNTIRIDYIKIILRNCPLVTGISIQQLNWIYIDWVTTQSEVRNSFLNTMRAVCITSGAHMQIRIHTNLHTGSDGCITNWHNISNFLKIFKISKNLQMITSHIALEMQLMNQLRDKSLSQYYLVVNQGINIYNTK